MASSHRVPTSGSRPGSAAAEGHWPEFRELRPARARCIEFGAVVGPSPRRGGAWCPPESHLDAQFRIEPRHAAMLQSHVAVAHIQLLLDCIDICETSASFMLRGSPRHHLTCGACAEVCQSCATSCEAMRGDAAMQYCADVCRRCAGSCGAMSTSRAPS
jgi:hypothetical protein